MGLGTSRRVVVYKYCKIKNMITALIRTHAGREELTERAVKSAKDQGCEVILVHDLLAPRADFSYNLLCNDLKAQVTEGFFFFLDSDDFIIPDAILTLKPYLEDENTAYVVQMLRNGQPKPRLPWISKGRIGLPCLFLHSKHRHLADIGGDEYGDYHWIKAVTDAMKWEFLSLPVVDAGKRNYGH